MSCIVVSIIKDNAMYPKQLAVIHDSSVNPVYKMFPIDLGNGEALQITIERKKIV